MTGTYGTYIAAHAVYDIYMRMPTRYFLTTCPPMCRMCHDVKIPLQVQNVWDKQVPGHGIPTDKQFTKCTWCQNTP